MKQKNNIYTLLAVSNLNTILGNLDVEKTSNIEPAITSLLNSYVKNQYEKLNKLLLNNGSILKAILILVQKYSYVKALQDKTQKSIYEALGYIRKQALKDGRPINVLQTDNGIEFRNASINNWAERHDIEQEDDKKCRSSTKI